MALSKGLPRVREKIVAQRYGNLLAAVPTYLYSGARDVLLISHGHKRSKTGYAVGKNDFLQVSQKLTHTGGPVMTSVRNNVKTVMFPLGTSPGYTQMPAAVTPNFGELETELKALSATGRARTRPGNPVASLGQFVIELRQLPQAPFKRLFARGSSLGQIPRRLLRELSDFRNLGSEYLNVVFGWKPFVNDLRQMYNLYQTIDKQIAKLVRENGKVIRRSAGLGSDTFTTSESENYAFAGVSQRGYPSSNLHRTPAGTTWTYTKTVKERTWYVANYKYYIPDTGSSLWNARAKAALFGALPTPELLWNVMPWSWLIDWFTNVGDVISNVSPNAVDNLVTLGSFIMRETKTVELWHATSFNTGVVPPTGPPFINDWPSRNCTTTTRYELTVKARVGGGNPFGLNASLPDLTAGQLAILAAVGISRGKVQ